ncbi:MAG: ribosome small subunit-dependent GTPase A [bacterium]|nr:ribosome small subunit-dependent GTPase A [bacterium]
MADQFLHSVDHVDLFAQNSEAQQRKCQHGLVVKEQSGFFWVELADGTVYMCRLRGRLMEEAQSSDIAAIGDRVQISILEQDESGLKGVIEAVEERHSALSRAARTEGQRGAGEAEREQVIIANADLIFFVFAAAQPTPNMRMLDRFLVVGEKSGVDQLAIVVNKIDLEDPTNIHSLFKPYQDIGYTVLYTSARDGQGVDDLRSLLTGKISAFAGPSGVGKTSLLNLLQPGLGRQVKQVSNYHEEGQHTTRDSALIKLVGDDYGSNTYLADTPGIRYLSIYDVEPTELDAYFVDIAPYVSECRFGDCTHTNEPGCAVRKAVAHGEIHKGRYHSYLKLRAELEEAFAIY